MSMSMPVSSATGSSTAASATSTATVMDHSGMDMGASGAKPCKISMTWNWYTIDSLLLTGFLAKSWHINTSAQFAGTCIGVILMVVLLEALRRLSKEYDALILREHMSKKQLPQPGTSVVTHNEDAARTATNNTEQSASVGKKASNFAILRRLSAPFAATATSFRPSLIQQCIRAFVHMLQFGLAYFVMLMAMYYNGYVIICIIIGAFIGYFIFSWQSIQIAGMGNGNNANEVTYCCG
ncbi:hypothetical protein FKW77_002244 [Venturia effusa]|uniref:Copper transport protein n=1 Tax=Venturia effusa TaxID=50376 RepID=A0A517L0V0_9PEZI|nr:hypothetical protein FKW77_002244 [Venturia effusa]